MAYIVSFYTYTVSNSYVKCQQDLYNKQRNVCNPYKSDNQKRLAVTHCPDWSCCFSSASLTSSSYSRTKVFSQSMSWILVSVGSYRWIFWLGVLTGYSLLLSYTLSTEPQSWKILGGKWRKFLLVRSYYGRSTGTLLRWTPSRPCCIPSLSVMLPCAIP